ncbi:dihydrolipoyllysine-residue acetyltransferase [Alteromonas pelagimontana]|uniref:Dihydrolipoamide acetyltransferase component of pyruvate dehydrogenase complex n=1 Tax=Alteromonas pelagimontana TaxID=1858656 RepID=A0A6M4MHN8_9ALTE|nr:dihydrolipoyllysine-residue acetyltransferase [Alteromonas pelagimontana]QJR82593.1 dihydrolipoyllysine-residue acetyltransferase [Alteromonas pelagimontana]
MTTEFILPDIGEGIVECELLEWLVSEGEHIAEDQPVAEVMTDKATVQIPAMHAGTVVKLHYKVGDIAQVHKPLFAMSIEGASPGNDDHADASAADPQKQSENEASQFAHQSELGSDVEDFILPDIGEGIVECEIVKWHVQEGDAIEEDQPVVEVMTDKAVVEIPAKHAGTVHKLYYQQGDIAKVHAPLFALSVASTSAEKSTAALTSDNDETTEAIAASPSTKPVSEQRFADGAYEPPVVIPGKVLASPAVRRMAREQEINLADITGSGKKGRILKKDLQNSSASATLMANNETSGAVTNENPGQGGVRVEKVRGVRAAMAKQMSASVHTIPHFTVSDELQMDALMLLRSSLKPEFAEQGIKLSFMPFFIKALSLALQKFPIINSQLNNDGSELHFFDDHNIGFAVDSKIGLLVPNIKRVQDLSLLEIASQMQEIIEKAREGKLSGDSLKGGTISISNIGALGGITATPVINKPEAAIVALGKTQKLPRFNDDGSVIAQHIMQVNWSGDHRIIDGATMVKFNNLWCKYLADPVKMLMHLR